MNKICFLLIFLLITLSCYADDAKRKKAINNIIKYELGANLNVETITSSFKDSVNVHPFDSVCIRHAIYAWDGMYDFIDKFAHFVALFPEGTKNFSPKNLDVSNLDKYEPAIKSMRKSLNHYRTLITKVEEYKPYRTRRVYQDYNVKNGKGEVLRYRAFYFFNNDDEIERYFWFDKLKLDGAYTMILYAKDHSFEIVEKILEVAGYQLNPKLMTYILSEKEIEYDRKELVIYANRLKKRMKFQQIKANNNIEKSQITQPSQNQPNQRTTQKVDNKYLYTFKGEQYRVVKDLCGATYTKEAMEKFTKYAIANNTSMINYMLACGELVALKRNQVVTMVDKGFIISRVMLPNGSILYTDTENLSK